jgi:hypothetical protein
MNWGIQMPRYSRDVGFRDKAARSAGYGSCDEPAARKRIEQGFGWVEIIGGPRKLPRAGLRRVRGWIAWTLRPAT